MRIRSIKPEFWRSDDIDALSIPDRLLFIGLWSYVDDNGVGLCSLKDIVGDLFAGDMTRDSQETLQRVSEGLRTLSRHGLIEVYRVDDKDYLHITHWSDHQVINHPAKARYPLPDKGSEPPLMLFTETLKRPSGESLAWNRGTGEQGNRGYIPPIAPQGGQSEFESESRQPSTDPIPEFDQLMAIYPNHDNPDDGLRELKRVLHRKSPHTSFAALLAGAQILANEHRDPRYVPTLGNWLRKGGWKNKPRPRAPASSSGMSRAQQNEQAQMAQTLAYAQRAEEALRRGQELTGRKELAA